MVAAPVRTAADVDRLRAARPPSDVGYVAEAVRLLVAELGATPLIGFAGAPFTLASYLIEGGPSRTHAKTKALMYGEPTLWHALCARLAEITAGVPARCRSAPGVSAVQLFDSWAGALSEADYRRYVLPHSAPCSRAGRHRGAADPLRRRHRRAAAARWARPARTWSAWTGAPRWTGPRAGRAGRAVQGNLDPALLFAPWPVVEAEVRRVLAEGRAAPGHVFNLGHGVLPETDPDVLTRLVDRSVHGALSPR